MGGVEESRSLVFLIETERGQRVINSAAGIAGFLASLNLFKKSRYGGKSDDFENYIRLRPAGENLSRPLTLLPHFLSHEMKHYRFKQPVLITGIADFVQVYARYTVSLVQGMVVFHSKVLNITSF